MPGPTAIVINLSVESDTDLSKVVKAHQTGQQIVLRARIILAAGQGHSNSQIARELGVDLDTVRLWRKRWQMLEAIPLSDLSVAERLEDLPRPGAPARITAAQRCQIEALACEKPEASARPISQWTAREIADELIKRGIWSRPWLRLRGRNRLPCEKMTHGRKRTPTKTKYKKSPCFLLSVSQYFRTSGKPCSVTL